MARRSFSSIVLSSLMMAFVSPAANAMMFDTGGGHAVTGLAGIGLLMAIQLGLALALDSLGRRIPTAFVLVLWIIELGLLLLSYPIALFYFWPVLIGFGSLSLTLWLTQKLPPSRLKLWSSLGMALAAWLLSIGLARWLIPKTGIGESHPIESDVDDWTAWIVVLAFHGFAIGYCLYRALASARLGSGGAAPRPRLP